MNSALNKTTIISDKLSAKINELKQLPGEEILLFGSPTATHALIQQNLIDGYWPNIKMSVPEMTANMIAYNYNFTRFAN